MKDEELVDKAIKWAEKQGYKEIKSIGEGYDSPTSYTQAGEEQPIIPDVTGLQMGRKSYFEIATKADDIRRKISKWKLLSTLAAMKGGKLFLLAPRGHKAFAESMVEKHNLSARVVFLNN